MASEWRRQLNGWLQEHMLAVTSVGTIISTFMFLIGVLVPGGVKIYRSRRDMSIYWMDS